MSKLIKQGQTVYYIDCNDHKGPCALCTVESHFIYSQKVKLPPLGAIIEKMPVTFVNNLVGCGATFYKSRRKALTACNRRNELIRARNRRNLVNRLYSKQYCIGVNDV